MSDDINLCQVGENFNPSSFAVAGDLYHVPYEDYALRHCGDFVFQKSGSQNMNNLWRHFHSKENYPVYYLGIAKKIAICRCPRTGKEEWYNGERCLSIDNQNPEKNSLVNITYKCKDKVFNRDFIFVDWLKAPVHEWSMKSGTTLQLEQKFVDGLLAKEKRQLGMTK
jgi:hypothetical protein